MQMIRVNFHLTKRQVEVLNKLKDETGTPVAQSIRRILDEWIEERELTRSKVRSNKED